VTSSSGNEISVPLRINRNKGLIGSGMDQTVIFAKDFNWESLSQPVERISISALYTE